MPYKVHKLIEDKRNNTCGFQIPNGGFYHVVEMTFENHKQLSDLSNRQGYSVDLVDGKTGFYDCDGYAVDRESVEIHKITKQVIGYKRKTYTYRGKEKEIQEKHISMEREQIITSARAIGMRVNELSSTQSLKHFLERARKAPQSSLSSALN